MTAFAVVLLLIAASSLAAVLVAVAVRRFPLVNRKYPMTKLVPMSQARFAELYGHLPVLDAAKDTGRPLREEAYRKAERGEYALTALDAEERAKEKQLSRDADSREQLSRENGHFAGLKVRIDFSDMSRIG